MKYNYLYGVLILSCLPTGVHDLQMCELSLDETGLTRKKGAEILGKDFEVEWNKNGGRELLKTCGNRISSGFLQKRLGVIRK